MKKDEKYRVKNNQSSMALLSFLILSIGGSSYLGISFYRGPVRSLALSAANLNIK